MAEPDRVEMESPTQNSPHKARALWYVEQGRVELRPQQVFRAQGEVLLRMVWSGISRGTERLIFRGQVPPAEFARMRAPLQDGSFPYPVKYGYCAVGRIEEAEDLGLKGKLAFCLAPHQTLINVPASMVCLVPQALPARRAALAANMETALNGVWDSGAGPGDRIYVIGAGLVGLLTAYLCAQLPGADVTVVDRDTSRAQQAQALGLTFATPEAVQNRQDGDVVFHASASAAGLASALQCAGLEAKVIELSWYGAADVAAPLGGAFHSQRLQLISSQVGQVSPSRRPRWTYARRLAKALELLCDDRLDALITDEVAFEDLPQMLPQLLGPDARGLASVVRYDP